MGCKNTKITKACVCLSLVFSTLLHKIPPSLFSIPSLLSLQLLPPPCYWSVGQLHRATNLLSPHPSGSESTEGKRKRSSQHQSLRAEEVGDDLQTFCPTLTGLTGRRTLFISYCLCFLRRSSSSMSSSSGNLHNKHLPCKSFL